MENKIYILLPVYNRKETTLRFIKNLKAQTYKNIQLVLIDDGSTDGTAEMVKQEMPEAKILCGNGNLWWGGSLHKGYKWVKANSEVRPSDVVLITNDDISMREDFLSTGVRKLLQHEKAFILAQCLSEQTGKMIDPGIHYNWQTFEAEPAKGVDEINCLATRGLFMRARDFLSVGGFHPILLPHYMSDYEFTIRAGRKGIKLLTDPELQVKTNEAASATTIPLKGTLREKVKTLFSKRCYENPIYISSFIFFAAPRGWKMRNFLRTWNRTWYTVYDDLPRPLQIVGIAARKITKVFIRTRPAP